MHFRIVHVHVRTYMHASGPLLRCRWSKRTFTSFMHSKTIALQSQLWSDFRDIQLLIRVWHGAQESSWQILIQSAERTPLLDGNCRDDSYNYVHLSNDKSSTVQGKRGQRLANLHQFLLEPYHVNSGFTKIRRLVTSTQNNLHVTTQQGLWFTSLVELWYRVNQLRLSMDPYTVVVMLSVLQGTIIKIGLKWWPSQHGSVYS